MATYSFVAYDPSAFIFGGGTVQLDPGFNFATQTTTIRIDDGDSFFDGDEDSNESGDDSNQYDSGTTNKIYAEERYILSNGTELTRVEIGGVLQGFILNGPSLTPGTTYTISSTQNVTEDNGDAYGSLNDVTCFVSGTVILTPQGCTPVEKLRPGDTVITLDNGLQTIRGVSQKTVLAVGRLAPIRLSPGPFGNTSDLLLSPQHRVLLCDPMAEMYFGQHEVLASAKHLAGHCGACVDGRFKLVTYCHFVLDRHEIIFANGARVESLFLPELGADVIGPADMVPDTIAGLMAAHTHTARASLRKPEAALLLAAMKSAPTGRINAARSAPGPARATARTRNAPDQGAFADQAIALISRAAAR